MKDKLNRLDAILNELQMDEYLNEDSLPKIGEARGLVNELVKNCSIPVVMQSCDTCKNLSTCRFWQEAPNNGATCKFYIEHVA